MLKCIKCLNINLKLATGEQCEIEVYLIYERIQLLETFLAFSCPPFPAPHSNIYEWETEC